MSMETISDPVLSFSVNPGYEFTDLGKVKETRWLMFTKWTPTSTYGYDLQSLELLRVGYIKEVLILVNIMQSQKDQIPLYLHKNFSMCLNAGRGKITLFPADFIAAFDITDKLRGTIAIFDMVNDGASEEKKIDPFPQLSEDFACLLNELNQFSDITLKCVTSEIPVHKCILSARSPVFNAMFRNQDMQESHSGTVDIIDVEAGVLQAMLRYIYSGKVDDDLTDVLAGDLLFAADKYELEVLKLICVDKLKSSLSMNNIYRILVLGYLHDEGLKEHTKRFICEQDKFLELEETEEWKSLQKEHPVLAMEVLTSVVKYLKSSS